MGHCAYPKSEGCNPARGPASYLRNEERGARGKEVARLASNAVLVGSALQVIAEIIQGEGYR